MGHAPFKLRADRDLALAVLGNFENMSMGILPQSLLEDTSIWIELARLGKLLYIPNASTLIDEICYQLLQHEMLEDDVVDDIVNHLGGLPHEAWSQLNPSQSHRVFDFLLSNYSWPDLSHDKQLMIKFCANETALERILVYCSESPLMEDYEVVQVMLCTNCDTVDQLPQSVQTSYPDLVVYWIENSEDADELVDDIAEDLWFNLDVTLAWLRNADGEVPEVDLLEIHRTDKEIILTAAEFNWDFFDYLPRQFRSDKDFFCQMVTRNGRSWTLLDDKWKRNFDITLAAFAGSFNLAYYCTRDDFEFVVKFAKSARNKLREHDKFVSYVLGSIDISGGTNCPFNVLNQGKDTSLVYKRLLGECSLNCCDKLQPT